MILPIGGFYKSRKTGETHRTQMHTCRRRATARAMICGNNTAMYAGQLVIYPFARSIGHQTHRCACAAGRGRKHHIHSQTVRNTGHVIGCFVARGAQNPKRCDNRIGAKSDVEGGEDRTLPPEPNGDKSIGQDQTGCFWSFCDSGI